MGQGRPEFSPALMPAPSSQADSIDCARPTVRTQAAVGDSRLGVRVPVLAPWQADRPVLSLRHSRGPVPTGVH